jgi:dipeptidase D
MEQPMASLLDGGEPQVLWHYFLALARIPRGSRHESAAADWVAAQGRALGCAVARDAVGNVRLRKPACPGREDRPGLALQAHVDMVCEKNEGTAHDFLKDPIPVYRDGDLLRARGTTLGADNGIGVAAALAVLASPEIQHGDLEVLITVDEETGMTGAFGLPQGWLRSAYLLNLDSEVEGELIIGCAGGTDTVARRRIDWVAPMAGRVPVRVRVYGLKGGHSGMDIAANRGNAIRILAEVLAALGERVQWQLARVDGGNKRNAIPREAAAVLFVRREDEALLRAEVARLAGEWQAAFGPFSPQLAMAVEPWTATRAMADADASAVLGLLLAGPHGVEAMSPDLHGLVQTSTNLGVVATGEDAVEVGFLSRSALDSARQALARRCAAVARLAGFEADFEAGYPGWRPVPDSDLVRLCDRVHRQVTGQPMVIKALHAGLECGLFTERLPGVQMASLGPSMWDVHTPDERVSIASVANFWRLLVAIVAAV